MLKLLQRQLRRKPYFLIFWGSLVLPQIILSHMEEIIKFLESRLERARKTAEQRRKEDASFMRITRTMIDDTFGLDLYLEPIPDAVAPIGVIQPEPVEVLPEYEGPWELWIEGFEEQKLNKLQIVKLIKERLDIGLKEAKELLDTIPAFICTIDSKLDSMDFLHQLMINGAITSLRKPVKKYSLTITGVHHWGNKQMIMDILTYQVGNKSLVNCKVHEFSSLLPLVVLTSEDEDRVEQLYNFLREKGAIIHKLII